MHQDIYGQQNPKGNNLYTMGKPLDDGYSALLALNGPITLMPKQIEQILGSLDGKAG